MPLTTPAFGSRTLQANESGARKASGGGPVAEAFMGRSLLPAARGRMDPSPTKATNPILCRQSRRAALWGKKENDKKSHISNIFLHTSCYFNKQFNQRILCSMPHAHFLAFFAFHT